MYTQKIRTLLCCCYSMLPPGSAFNLHAKAAVRSGVHCAIWSAKQSCLLRLICGPPASCFWHPRARRPDLCCGSEKPEKTDFPQEAIWYRPLPVTQCTTQGRMENANGNPALIAW